jgi:hypothetical protein
MKMNRLRIVVLLLVAPFWSGCAKTEKPASSNEKKAAVKNNAGEQASSTQATSAKSVSAGASQSTNIESPLVGVWLGTAGLDEGLLQRKMDSLPDEESRAKLLSMARTFSSTYVGLQFDPDRNLEMDMIIEQPDGTPIRDRSSGTWEIAQVDGKSVTVHLHETIEGKTESSTKCYVFQDNDQFVLIPAVVPDLRDCNPVIVFVRESLADPAETASSEQQENKF